MKWLVCSDPWVCASVRNNCWNSPTRLPGCWSEAKHLKGCLVFYFWVLEEGNSKDLFRDKGWMFLANLFFSKKWSEDWLKITILKRDHFPVLEWASQVRDFAAIDRPEASQEDWFKRIYAGTIGRAPESCIYHRIPRDTYYIIIRVLRGNAEKP